MANTEDKQPRATAQEMVDGLRRIFGPLTKQLRPEMEPAVIYTLQPTDEGAQHSE